jgi:hypothetical protein
MHVDAVLATVEQAGREERAYRFPRRGWYDGADAAGDAPVRFVAGAVAEHLDPRPPVSAGKLQEFRVLREPIIEANPAHLSLATAA